MEEFLNVPTVAETLPGFVEGGYQGILTRAGTPPEIINKLNVEVNKIIKMPDVRERLAALGAEPYGGTPEAMRQFLREDKDRWARLIKDLNFKLEQ
jgi:tripartite-type tricarboxylate transporter receptor subunit TctC